MYFTLCWEKYSCKIFTLGIQTVPCNSRNHLKPHLLIQEHWFVFSETKSMEGTPCWFSCHFLLQSPILLGDNMTADLKTIFLSFFVCHRSLKICHISEVQAKCCWTSSHNIPLIQYRWICLYKLFWSDSSLCHIPKYCQQPMKNSYFSHFHFW